MTLRKRRFVHRMRFGDPTHTPTVRGYNLTLLASGEWPVWSRGELHRPLLFNVQGSKSRHRSSSLYNFF